MKAKAVVLALAIAAATPGAYAAGTTCSFGGPTPGFRVVRIDVPKGADFATIRITSSRPAMPLGDRSSWHLAMGFAIVDATTHEMLTTRIYNTGSATRRTVVVADGSGITRQEFPGPDASFVHSNWVPVNRLPAGSYYLIGFGTDGDQRLPNPTWGAEFHIDADVDCASAARPGELFDLDHSSFDQGTQVSASIAGVAMAAGGSFSATHPLVFGLMDVAQQGTGDARLDYTFPGGRTGSMANDIAPFFSTAGEHDFATSFSGFAPIAEIAAVAFDA